MEPENKARLRHGQGYILKLYQVTRCQHIAIFNDPFWFSDPFRDEVLSLQRALPSRPHFQGKSRVCVCACVPPFLKSLIPMGRLRSRQQREYLQSPRPSVYHIETKSLSFFSHSGLARRLDPLGTKRRIIRSLARDESHSIQCPE